MGELFGVHYALDKLFEHARSGAAEPLLVPPGLLLSLGDGSAVSVTAEMLAAATDRNGAWARASESARRDTIELVQKWIDRLIQQAQEARDVG